ncbi:restriction endonuclease subunit S [Mammaliicoccus sciuri]|uniref:restriction endonuclease subunit S n=1 Tax=Mammaliicoccus sciuri TaxID=1296 RepID=UPI003978775D
MTNGTKNVPELRFPEFDGEWEENKLIDVLKDKSEGIKRGPFGGALKKDIFIEDGYAIYEQRNAIYDMQQFRYFITQQKYDEMIGFAIKPNDIIMSCSGTIGKLSLIPENAKQGIINQALIRFRTNDKLLSNYFLIYMNSRYMQRKILESNPGSAITNLIPVKELKKLNFPSPKINEQKKIGEFFSKLDRQIELEEQKLAKLEEQKKGYMQKIFSQELRFKDENGNTNYYWCDFKINDLFSKIESGNRLPKTNLKEGSIPYVIAQTTNNGIFMYISENTLDYHNNKIKLFPKGSITISIDNPEAMFIQKEDFFTSNVMRVLHNENLKNESHIFIMESLKKLTQSYNWSVKFSGPIIMNSVIKLPIYKNSEINWDIVNKIGNLFNKLDKKINIQSNKIESLKQRKQGLLQKMFI